MTQVPLAPPPPSKDPQQDKWMWLLWRRLTQAGQILWESLSFTGSSLNDIEEKKLDYLDLTNPPPALTEQPARLWWNDADGTVNIGMGYDGVVQQIGLEQFYHVKNQTGSTLLNGRVARAVGTVGNSGQILAGYAIADNTHLARYVLGVLTMDIPDGEDGYVTSFGLVRQINTTGAPFGETWADGDVLYVSPTTAGYLTKTEPSAPDQKVVVAIVVHAQSNGSLFVRPTFGSLLGDLHDVSNAQPTDGQSLVWDNTVGVWKPGVAKDAVSIVYVDTVLTDSIHTVVVTATGKTITLPAASTGRIGRNWSVIFATTGTCTINTSGSDTFPAPSSTTETSIILTQCGQSVVFKCTSATTWGLE